MTVVNDPAFLENALLLAQPRYEGGGGTFRVENLLITVTGYEPRTPSVRIAAPLDHEGNLREFAYELATSLDEDLDPKEIRIVEFHDIQSDRTIVTAHIVDSYT